MQTHQTLFDMRLVVKGFIPTITQRFLRSFNMRIIGIYFSPTGGTRKVVEYVCAALAERMATSYRMQSYTLPSEREYFAPISSDDFVVWGSPVYAGRIPNKSVDFVRKLLVGPGCRGVAIAVYGGRHYDNALAEMRELMLQGDIIPIAATAVVARHSFAPQELSAGRPNAEDMQRLSEWCQQVDCFSDEVVQVPGSADSGYYRPLKADGQPAIFLRAKPVVQVDRCNGCSICASKCPMGSIGMEGGSPQFQGICIKCQACIFSCPQQALCFSDPDFLSHIQMLRSVIGADELHEDK